MFIRATVASALLAFADAQGMGDGLAKSTRSVKKSMQTTRNACQ